MSLWQRVVQANRPGPAEHSVPFRVASSGAVVTALAACWSQGELSALVALFAIAATVAGNVLSFRTRRRPLPLVKPILAVCVVAGFVWFIATVTHSATPGDISSVEGPLAVLFAWVLTTHAFDVPARRDVAYSLAGSAALMAVAAAQTVDLSIGPYVVAWLACGLWGLVAMWQSMTSARGVPWAALSGAAVAIVVLTVLVMAVLPAPHVSTSLIFPSSSAGSSPVTSGSGLTDGNPSLPARAASPRGRIGVGGYLGFAKSLDTADRLALGNQVVLRVRASRPGYWVGQTYDTWNGQSWSQSAPPPGHVGTRTLTSSSPYQIAPSASAQTLLGPSTADVETFYLAQSGPNLVFHTQSASQVYIKAPHLYLTGGGTIVSSSSMGAGTVYTVVSADNRATPAELRATPPGSHAQGLAASPGIVQQSNDLQLPHSDPRVAALARRITATVGAGPGTHTYDDVVALQSWMADHIRYSTDIPPLPAGADAVDSFLFGSRVGYCEQISTALAIMLRTLGIPAREAVGYVPGSYNPITDLYDVQAKDAHAWVQVWFAGWGWQSFDPTAQVPSANPSPGSVLARQVGRSLAHLPWAPVGVALGLGALVMAVLRRRAMRPPTWAHLVASRLERGGARIGLPRRPSEPLTAYAARLEEQRPASAGGVGTAAATVERAVYGAAEPSADEIARSLQSARQISPRRWPVRRRTWRRPRAGDGRTSTAGGG